MIKTKNSKKKGTSIIKFAKCKKYILLAIKTGKKTGLTNRFYKIKIETVCSY